MDDNMREQIRLAREAREAAAAAAAAAAAKKKEARGPAGSMRGDDKKRFLDELMR